MNRHHPERGRSLIALAALVAAVTGVSCGRSSQTQVDRGQAVAAAFLDEVRAGRIDPAWQGTTVEFKSLMGSDSLRDYARAHPALKAAAEFVASQPVGAGGGPKLMEYQFRATPPPAGRKKTPATPKTIRVMVSLADDPPRVERLASE